MATKIINIGGLKGKKTKFYNDVKVPIKAGMAFNSKQYKIQTVGYDIFRHYFDDKNKDYQVGVQRVKRVIKK